MTMHRTVTVEIPDAFTPLLDRVLATWAKKGKPPEETLWNVLRHGLEMMDIPERPETGLPGKLGNDMDDDIPF